MSGEEEGTRKFDDWSSSVDFPRDWLWGDLISDANIDLFVPIDQWPWSPTLNLSGLLQHINTTNTPAGNTASFSTSACLSLLAKCAVLMVCRTCGKKGDHWTSRCPYKDLAEPSEGFIDKPLASEVPTVTSGPSKGSYVPPGMRPGAERTGTDMRRRNEENSVRVTNLSEDTREADLHELFRTFGSVSRVYVPVDQKTDMSRGFGFVNFVNKEDAEKAINKLNGYGYDNLILRVEWAAPRAN